MFFTIKSATANKQHARAWVLYGAKVSIDFYKITPAHKKLNNLLWERYGLNIKAASTLVLTNSKIQRNNSGEFIITFPSKKIDELASLITYGDGQVQGCSILKDAFLRDAQ